MAESPDVIAARIMRENRQMARATGGIRAFLRKDSSEEEDKERVRSMTVVEPVPFQTTPKMKKQKSSVYSNSVESKRFSLKVVTE